MGVCTCVSFPIHLPHPTHTHTSPPGPPARRPRAARAGPTPCRVAKPTLAARRLPMGAYPEGSETCDGRNFSGRAPLPRPHAPRQSHTQFCPFCTLWW